MLLSRPAFLTLALGAFAANSYDASAWPCCARYARLGHRLRRAARAVEGHISCFRELEPERRQLGRRPRLISILSLRGDDDFHDDALCFNRLFQYESINIMCDSRRRHAWLDFFCPQIS